MRHRELACKPAAYHKNHWSTGGGYFFGKLGLPAGSKEQACGNSTKRQQIGEILVPGQLPVLYKEVWLLPSDGIKRMA
jgi:hypothetical protein